MRLKDKVAIVTGAASGIGRATAELFAEEGAKVVVADMDEQNGNAVVKGIQAKGGTAQFVRADISKEADAKNISDAAVKSFGKLDIAVNSAATFVLKGFETTPAEWHQSLGVNVIGTALVTKYAVEHIKKQGGAVVNIGSISSFLAQPDFFAYSATKAAIVQMSRNMAMDVAKFGIRVNCVCPGTILTAATQHHMDKVGISLEEFNKEEGAKNFITRIGQPREVAYAVLFFASDESSFVTGAHLMVDGGYSAQ